MTSQYTHPDHDPFLAKAGTLIEALPRIGQFAGETAITRYGGNAMIDDDLKRAFVEDIVFLRCVGLKPVAIYDSGPQISSTLERLGITSRFRGGLRVTTSEATDVMHMVPVRQVGRELVGPVNARSPFIVGMSGKDSGLLRTRRCGLVEGSEEIDLGFVGDVDSVDPSALLDLIEADRIPVVATVAPGPNGQTYNANVNTAISALTPALGAECLVMLTDVAGLYANYSDKSTIILSITPEEVRQLMPGLTSGMAPRMETCTWAVEGGVRSATIINGYVLHCLLLETFIDDGVGTIVCEEPV